MAIGTPSRQILASAALVLAGVATSHAVTTLTATDVTAVTTFMTGDLGDTQATIAGTDGGTPFSVDFVASGGTNDHLSFAAGDGGFTPDTLGVVGVKAGEFSSGQTLTIDFNSDATVSQVVLGKQGSNDISAIIGGFAVDPGATLNPLDPGETDVFPISFDSQTGELTITSDGNGFIAGYEVNFANSPIASALTFTSPTTNGGSGGVGLGSVTFTPGVAFVPGDVDGDGVVETATVGALGDDLGPIISNFFTNVASRSDGDLSGDGLVDFVDFREWKDNVPGGSSLSLAALLQVPEPTSGALALGLAAAALAGSRRRR